MASTRSVATTLNQKEKKIGVVVLLVSWIAAVRMDWHKTDCADLKGADMEKNFKVSATIRCDTLICRCPAVRDCVAQA